MVDFGRESDWDGDRRWTTCLQGTHHEQETAFPSPRGEALPPVLGGTSLEKAVPLVKMSRLSTQCDEAQWGSAPRRGP